MEGKIKQYVNYQFRFDTREDLEDLKTEIIANLTDRYNENITDGKKPEEAYIDAIKSMGDFTDNNDNIVPEEYSVKPSIPDILLMSSAILSIFGLLLTLFNAVIGTLITALSILTYSGAAYYLYSYSQYVRKEHMDIEKHNLLLFKIFKYMKTCFAFWSISLSFTMASLVMSLITRLILLDPSSISFKHIESYIALYGVFFIVALLIFLLIFKSIYTRLMRYYYYLTGTTNLEGKVSEGFKFLYGEKGSGVKSFELSTIILSKKFMPIFISIILTINLIINLGIIKNGNHYFDAPYIIQLVYQLRFSDYPEIFLAPTLVLILNVILLTLSFMKELKKQWLLIMGWYMWFFSTISMNILAANITSINASEPTLWIEISDNVLIYVVYMTILLTIVTIFRYILGIICKKKEL